MFRHYCGLYNRIKNDEELQKDSSYANRSTDLIRPIIYKALKEGLLLPENCETIVSYNDGNPFGELAVKIDIDNEKITPFLRVKSEELDGVNLKRKAIGLPPISNSSTSLLDGTWYSEYPFKEVKQAVENCDTCSTFLNYVLVRAETEQQVAENFEKIGELEGFLLVDYTKVKGKYYYYQYMKNLRKNGFNTKRTK